MCDVILAKTDKQTNNKVEKMLYKAFRFLERSRWTKSMVLLM